MSAGIDPTAASRSVCRVSSNEQPHGLFDPSHSAVPVEVAGMSRVHSISAGGAHLCALDASSEMKCVGSNFFGQLGDGTTETRTDPVYVAWPDP